MPPPAPIRTRDIRSTVRAGIDDAPAWTCRDGAGSGPRGRRRGGPDPVRPSDSAARAPVGRSREAARAGRSRASRRRARSPGQALRPAARPLYRTRLLRPWRTSSSCCRRCCWSWRSRSSYDLVAAGRSSPLAALVLPVNGERVRSGPARPPALAWPSCRCSPERHLRRPGPLAGAVGCRGAFTSRCSAAPTPSASGVAWLAAARRRSGSATRRSQRAILGRVPWGGSRAVGSKHPLTARRLRRSPLVTFAAPSSHAAGRGGVTCSWPVWPAGRRTGLGGRRRRPGAGAPALAAGVVADRRASDDHGGRDPGERPRAGWTSTPSGGRCSTTTSS